jgi:hypothetical protein
MSILFNFEVGSPSLRHFSHFVISSLVAIAVLVVMSCPGSDTGFVMVIDLVAGIPCRLGFTETKG